MSVRLSCWIDTFTVWIPDLYPEPVLPILIEVIVPAILTIAVPPAATKGWYPQPSVEPTETTVPPRGRLVALASLSKVDTSNASPTKVIVVIPYASESW